MKYKVVKKQKISKKCFVCGRENEFGLKTSFYELENGEIVALCRLLDEHQSYPGRLHGGMAGMLLDETIGRAIFIKQEDVWGVTVELKTKFHKPIPLDEKIRIVGRITRDTRMIYEGTGEILLSNGDVAVSAVGKYVKIPLEQIADIEDQNDEWVILNSDSDPVEIEI